MWSQAADSRCSQTHWKRGGDVRGICIDGGSAHFSRKDIDKLTESARSYGAKGLVWIRVNEDDINSSVNKFSTRSS